jgi:hypothetical protein
MPASTENIKRWIEQSNIDYTTYFIKAWIPFNAWYNFHFSSLDTDRAKINAAKGQSNPARNGINSYLENEGQPSDEFRNFLSALHFALQQTQLDGTDGRISFNEIVKERNPANLINNESLQGTKYFLKREDGTRLGQVTSMQVHLKDRNNNTFCSYNHTEYDLEHFQTSPAFEALSERRKENARYCFQRLHPIVVIDSIQDATKIEESPRNYYQCDSHYFVRDTGNPNCFGHVVCRALIETLYQLRNQLFHGELLPNESIQPIYKNAYFLLKMILEKTK